MVISPSIQAQVPAKINLTLDILGRRNDGYHELKSVMQTIALYDMLTLTALSDFHVTFDCSLPELANADNLVVRAMRLFCDVTGIHQGVHAHLHKGIPVQGGMGGGSADAAITLLALSTWWNVNLDTATLLNLAAQLGSDVPFFIYGGTALIEGRGEFVTPLPATPTTWLVIMKPAVNIATASVFRALTPAEYSDGSATDGIVEQLRKKSLSTLCDAPYCNALERGVLRDYPAVAAARQTFLTAGAHQVFMSGSGPTLYACFPWEDEARHVAAQIIGMGELAWAVPTVNKNGLQRSLK